MKFKDLAENYLINPFLGAITSVVGVMIGVIGSLYPETIKQTFLKFCLEYKCVLSIDTLISASFWFCVFGFGLLFWGVQWAQMKRTNSATQDITKQSDELEELVTRLLTLPPEGFLEKFQELYRSAFVISQSALLKEDATKKEIAHCVRYVMGILAALVKSFDGDPQNIGYHANIMIYKDKNIILDNPIEKKRIEGILKFTDGFSNIENYLGILELIPEFSTTSESKDFQVDNSINSIGLPIPVISEVRIGNQPKHKVLPGAPWSFVHKIYASFHSMDEFLKWCNERCDFSGSVKNDLKEYFTNGDGKDIKSFISYPLLPLSNKEKSDQPAIGVLNIHRNREGILTGRGKSKEMNNLGLKLFTPISDPFRILLVLLLQKYSSAN
ncbi:conserved hypothetical protein [Candidatus Methylobacter favarea]|uniref:Uncharacterized protein n=1 Tax=Candidatus Methylobacter favarea TaxID=2707345 RepID=A0A8S0WSD5_9GAMM|nr:hypothetical protein [Candidatus Methylobacter favarea]CAA9892641.1 conserved hypothetical protein [Candidatus Methylobacter favarea]